MFGFRVTVLFSFAALMLAACDKEEEHRKQIAAEYQKRLPGMEKSGIVAGPNEPTFEESQGVKLRLPMPERDFLALLDRLKLRYERTGEVSGIIPTPWHTKTLDISNVQKAYQIYGQWGRLNPRLPGQEMYRAYVDKSERVVYIENMFGYDGL